MFNPPFVLFTPLLFSLFSFLSVFLFPPPFHGLIASPVLVKTMKGQKYRMLAT
ncbi:hypothetical protein L873DRAFT_1797997 [Choiromyces venosus 120613-1]|uniref:Uncharacterized protein n=1 Tax=Choiromyces venosus 120613-1 TaxID=1336337 RepID=A0A3N4K6R3_9PEZI|nr:hypothetical protein L873DRAFT_1797997 [Choiromyces venosus 120613-1]